VTGKAVHTFLCQRAVSSAFRIPCIDMLSTRHVSMSCGQCLNLECQRWAFLNRLYVPRLNLMVWESVVWFTSIDQSTLSSWTETNEKLKLQ
jgi:hypothetical protein